MGEDFKAVAAGHGDQRNSCGVGHAHGERGGGGDGDHHRKIVARLEDFVRENPTTALCSEDLAQHLGASVRTLQTAMQAVHGMKLHQYLRLKRLWLVRRQLTKALPGVSVKVAAQSHGFWHMGEFSRLYKAVFGEMASETLLRARGCTA